MPRSIRAGAWREPWVTASQDVLVQGVGHLGRLDAEQAVDHQVHPGLDRNTLGQVGARDVELISDDGCGKMHLVDRGDDVCDLNREDSRRHPISPFAKVDHRYYGMDLLRHADAPGVIVG